MSAQDAVTTKSGSKSAKSGKGKSKSKGGKAKQAKASKAEAAADITLTDVPGGTELRFIANGGADGGIMKLGKAVIGNSAQKIIDGFFERIGEAMGVTVTPLGTIAVAQGVRPDQFTLASVDPDGLSFFELRAAIHDLADAGRPTKALEGAMWHKLSNPLSALLMPVLGAIAAFGLARSGKLFIRAIIGMALGFAYFVADNLALSLGNIGAYPPFLAAWAPFLLFLLIGEAVLIRGEE